MRVLSIIFGLISAFFVFYTSRLLVVTKALTQTRAGGHGAYIGAVAFPVIAPVVRLGKPSTLAASGTRMTNPPAFR